MCVRCVLVVGHVLIVGHVLVIGHALEEFNVDCEGWQDGTGLALQKLSYGYNYVLGENVIPVFTKTPVLPAGNKNNDYTYPFHVLIKNKFGVMTVEVINVTVSIALIQLKYHFTTKFNDAALLN